MKNGIRQALKFASSTARGALAQRPSIATCRNRLARHFAQETQTRAPESDRPTKHPSQKFDHEFSKLTAMLGTQASQYEPSACLRQFLKVLKLTTPQKQASLQKFCNTTDFTELRRLVEVSLYSWKEGGSPD